MLRASADRLRESLAKHVIPAQAGIQCFCNLLKFMDSRLRGNDEPLFFRSFARSSRKNGFSLIELAVALAVLAGLLYFLLDRVLYMQEVAEKTEVEETVRSINYGLRLEAASRLARGAEAGRPPMEKENPVKWLQSPPRNYLGEYAKVPEGAKPGFWYFHPGLRQLIYSPNRAEYLKVEAARGKELRFVVQPKEDTVSQPMLVSLAPYAWFGGDAGGKR